MLPEKIKSCDITAFRSRDKIVTQDDGNAEILNSIFSSVGEILEFPNFWKLIH